MRGSEEMIRDQKRKEEKVKEKRIRKDRPV
jgi:hypothetical protein